MSGRLQYNFYDLSTLATPGSTIAWVIADAVRAAKYQEPIDWCPYGTSRSQLIRSCRVAWRTSFRRMQERIRDAEHPSGFLPASPRAPAAPNEILVTTTKGAQRRGAHVQVGTRSGRMSAPQQKANLS
jgi:hypothetical protein